MFAIAYIFSIFVSCRVGLLCIVDPWGNEVVWSGGDMVRILETGGWLDTDFIDAIIQYWKESPSSQSMFQYVERVVVTPRVCTVFFPLYMVVSLVYVPYFMRYVLSLSLL